MNGKQYQYDPQVMFKDWIQKSGSSQSEFIKNFSQMMGNNIPLEFDPLKTLNEITTKATETQNNILENLSGIQKTGIWKNVQLDTNDAQFTRLGSLQNFCW